MKLILRHRQTWMCVSLEIPLQVCSQQLSRHKHTPASEITTDSDPKLQKTSQGLIEFLDFFIFLTDLHAPHRHLCRERFLSLWMWRLLTGREVTALHITHAYSTFPNVKTGLLRYRVSGNWFLSQALDFIHMLNPENIVTTNLPEKSIWPEAVRRVHAIQIRFYISMETLIIHNMLSVREDRFFFLCTCYPAHFYRWKHSAETCEFIMTLNT